MEQHHHHHNMLERRTFIKSKTPAVKWFKKWVPQDVVTTGGKCFVMKWVTEAQLNAMKKQMKELEAVKPEPEPETEVIFLCSYEGCGKTFIDAGTLRKHSFIHGERQYVCHYQNCGKKFYDSSKLKRHFLTHTGERDFVCPHEGCGKAFSLDFNLRSHIKTHFQENYHKCPYPECAKRYSHEHKLKKHIMSHHEKTNKDMMVEAPLKSIHVQSVERTTPNSTRASTATCAFASSARPYACPFERCRKAYIHEYKLNLHLKREHTCNLTEENSKKTFGNEMEAGSEHDGHTSKLANFQKQIRPKPNVKLPPAKLIQRNAPMSSLPVVTTVMQKHPWPVDKVVYEVEDSEETEDERDNDEDQGGYRDNNNVEDDDEETEYED